MQGSNQEQFDQAVKAARPTLNDLGTTPLEDLSPNQLYQIIWHLGLVRTAVERERDERLSRPIDTA